ncbi:AAA family ATPase [Arthrobacter sp. FW306-05-C]|uniref:ATP-dependent nuclease n=1 Tax=Arthrobacter sp. FW306-05-C TaxID=2879620 RepID=UPI001F017C74|nr:AAA family ATPase [Arthrobacter sp. FW306-05-C]UKA65432.1 AAA family ATPase [Arthrobacter sp. FW306-05-C]
MTLRENQLDDILRDHNTRRGNAENVSVGVSQAFLASGDVVEFQPAGVTVIAGANNCGKSTMLTELSQQLLGQDVHRRRIVISAHRYADGDHSDYADWLIKHAQFFVDTENASNAHFQRFGHLQPLSGFLYPDVMLNGPDNFNKERLFPFFVKHLPAGQRDIIPAQTKGNVLLPATEPLQLLSERKELMDELNAITYKILKKHLHLDDLNPQLILRVGTPTVPRPERQYDDKVAYQLDVESLPALAEQGDGMRSLLNILVPLVTATYPVLLIDEPEAFLHPPQAFALGQILGKIAADKKIQVILATHDRNILAGLVNAEAPLSVVRLVRQQSNPTRAFQLRSEDLRAIMKDPILKYSHVLDGLFHEVVVLAEAERDCRFYEAALDVHENNLASSGPEQLPTPLPATEVLFIPTGGTSNMPRLASALRSLNVPVVALPDLDVLDKRTVIKNIVEAVGGDWAVLEDDWQSVVRPLNAPLASENVVTVSDRVAKTFDSLIDQNPRALFDGDARKAVSDALKAPSRPWDDVKHHGVNELMRRNVGNTDAVTRLIQGLAQQRVVLVEAGELESFGYSLGVHKGKTWLPAALERGLQNSAPVQDQIGKLMSVVVPLTSWRR